MSFDLMLKSNCCKCGRTTDLYGSNCKHMTLCLKCGKELAEARAKCFDCGATLTRLIREYNVRASAGNEKNYFIGRFGSGLPIFSTKKKSSDTRWTLKKEGLQGRQVTDALKEKFKNKPWMLEDEAGQFQYHGHLEGAPSATYYLLVMQGREFVAIPADSWYNFNKVAQYRQLTLEEAEEMLKNRSKHTEQSRWIMKTSNPGLAAALGGNDKQNVKSNGNGGGPRRKKSEDGEGNDANRGEDDKAKGAKKGGDEFEDEAPVEDFDGDDDVEKGDDWEHEEIFTDDDEAVTIDPEEREDLGPEVPAPPEIKDDDEEEGEQADENEGGLSKSGKELKKLLGRANGLNDSDAEDDEDDEDPDEEDRPSPVLAPKKEAIKEESAETKPVVAGSAKGTPSPSKSAKGKRKTNGDDQKAANTLPAKKIKLENEMKTVKEEIAKTSVSTKGASSTSLNPPTSTQGPVSEDEIRTVLQQRASVTTQELVSVFKARLRSKEDKHAFAETLKRISKIQKTANGLNYVVLREK